MPGRSAAPKRFKTTLLYLAFPRLLIKHLHVSWPCLFMLAGRAHGLVLSLGCFLNRRQRGFDEGCFSPSILRGQASDQPRRACWGDRCACLALCPVLGTSPASFALLQCCRPRHFGCALNDSLGCLRLHRNGWCALEWHCRCFHPRVGSLAGALHAVSAFTASFH